MAGSQRFGPFSGMVNLPEVLLDPERARKEGAGEMPRAILNADVAPGGKLVRRDGYEKILNLSGAHSLWGCDRGLFCAAGGNLYRVDGGTARQICGIDGPVTERVRWTEAHGKIYGANGYWRSRIDPETNSVSDWGTEIPNAPVVSVQTGGSLLSGRYHICYTDHSGADISGSSEIITLPVPDGGMILLSGRPAACQVWISDPDGPILYRVGYTDRIASAPPTVEPLPTLFAGPPPRGISHIAWGHGRIWAAAGKTLYYSLPHRPELFREHTDFFRFPDPITLIAMVYTGIYVGTRYGTYWIYGTEPEKMEQRPAGPGAVPGTLQYCNDLPELGDTISPPEKTHLSVPVWLSYDGIVAGNAAGRLFSLTANKVRFNVPAGEGAGMYRKKGGVFQYLAGFMTAVTGGSAMGIGDDVAIEVVRNGKVI